MAVVKSNQEEQNNQQKGEQPLTLSQGQQFGGSATAQPSSRQRKGSGRFTNLQKYIDANQGAAERATGQIQRLADQSTKQSDQQSQDRLAGIRESIGQEKNRLGQAGQIAQTIQGGDTQAIQNLAQNQMQDVQALRTGQNIVGDLREQQQNVYQDMSGAAQRFGNIADQVKTEQGRFSLLRDAIGGPRYTAGQRSLDQLILQGGGRQGLRDLETNLAQEAQNRQQQLQSLGQEFTQDLSDIQSQVGQAQQDITSALGQFGADQSGALGQLYGDIESRRASEAARQSELATRAQEEFAQGLLSRDVAEALGITEDINTFDLDLSPYAQNIVASDPSITQADVATADEMARLEALGQLGGFDPYNLGQQSGQVGLQGLDLQALQSAADTRRQELVDEYLGLDQFDVLNPNQAEIERGMEILRTIGTDRQGLEALYNASPLAQSIMSLDEYIASNTALEAPGGVRLRPEDFTDIGSVE